VLVRSDRWGELDIPADKLLTFAEGLLGFPDAVQFVMVEVDDTEDYLWLQSVDDPGLAFLVVIPWAFFPEYAPEIDDATQADLGIAEPSNAIVLCLLTIRDNGDPPVTANLLGPLIINTVTRAGRQVVQADPSFPTRAALVGG
jgi:flagellar assembly factor FliW